MLGPKKIIGPLGGVQDAGFRNRRRAHYRSFYSLMGRILPVLYNREAPFRGRLVLLAIKRPFRRYGQNPAVVTFSGANQPFYRREKGG